MNISNILFFHSPSPVLQIAPSVALICVVTSLCNHILSIPLGICSWMHSLIVWNPQVYVSWQQVSFQIKCQRSTLKLIMAEYIHTYMNTHTYIHIYTKIIYNYTPNIYMYISSVQFYFTFSITKAIITNVYK